MLKQNRNKYAMTLLMSTMSLVFSLILVILFVVHKASLDGETTHALPLEFNAVALSVAVVFCAMLILMIIKRKKLARFDFLAISLIIILWFSADIQYLIECTSLQFPGDTQTLSEFYGIFYKTEIIKTYNQDVPLVMEEVHVNFEFIVSIILFITSLALYFVEKPKKKCEQSQ